MNTNFRVRVNCLPNNKMSEDLDKQLTKKEEQFCCKNKQNEGQTLDILIIGAGGMLIVLLTSGVVHSIYHLLSHSDRNYDCMCIIIKRTSS